MGTRRVVGLVVLACLGIGAPSADAAKRKRPNKARLAAIERCTDLLSYARAEAIASPYAVSVYQAQRPGGAGDEPQPAPVSAAPGSAERLTQEDASETNVQEAGVDEPDIVKSSGGIVYAVAGGRLHAVDARGGRTDLLSSLTLPAGYGHELLLSGNRLLVLSQGFDFLEAGRPAAPGGGAPGAEAPASFAPGTGAGATVLSEIDISDPRAPRTLRTLTVEGRLIGARRQGSVVRVVLTTPPSPIVLPAPAEGEPYATGEDFQRRRREAIAAAGPSTFLPDMTLRDERAGTERTGLLLGCQRMRRPVEDSGLDVLSVLTIDLDKGVEPVDRDGVLASGDDIYASDEGLYVATTRWWSPDGAPDSGTVVTRVHRFAAGRGAETRYRASGTVRGSVLNQFAFSEHRGVLRVATTEQPAWRLGPGAQQESESYVTVLDERDGVLVPIGRVGGLGKGETIHAVRFLGDAGYVVTFRQIDPLYVLDLADPQAPRVRGELKILGYSAYLHPVGEDLLLGVGQDATEQGRRRGAQVSLFDVSDPANPRRLHQRTFSPHSSSQVEWDHHAFLWWPKTRLAVLPLWDGADGGFQGAVGFRVSRADGLREVGRVQPAGSGFDAVQRSLVVGSRLLSLSMQGLVSSRLDDLTRVATVTLPGEQPSPDGPRPQPARG